jgi:uncharacterized membrane protein
VKTRKTLKTTGLIQLVYSLFLLVQVAISILYARSQIPVNRDSTLFRILDLYGGFATVLWLVPAATICFIINLAAFLKERRDLAQREGIGIRWLWIPAALLSVLAIKYLYLGVMMTTILFPDLFPV